MRSRRRNLQRPLRPRGKGMALEPLERRMLLSAGNDWSVGVDPNDLFDHQDADGEVAVFYSDPLTWGMNLGMGETNGLQGDFFVDEGFVAGETFKPLLSQNSAEVSSEVLAATQATTLYLDFDGADVSGQSADSWLYSYDAQIPAFDLGKYGWAGREKEAINYITGFVQEDYAAYNVEVTSQSPGASAGEYTTIFVGGTNDWFQPNSGVIGVATYDVGNRQSNNYGFAFSEELTAYFNYSSGSLQNFSEYLSNLITHEAGHTYGANHIDDTSAIMNPYLPLSPRQSMFGSNKVFGTNTFQDTQSLLGKNMGYAHGPDDFGDTAKAAEAIRENETIAGMLERRDDADVFEFTATADGTITLQVETGAFGNLNAAIEVYRDGDSAPLVTDGNSAGGAEASFAATAGQSYVIYLHSQEGNSSGSYTTSAISSSVSSPPSQIDPQAFAATTVALNPWGDEVIEGSWASGEDGQLYVVSLDLGGQITFGLQAIPDAGGFVALYDVGGQLLTWDVAGAGDAQLPFTAGAWQPVYVLVHAGSVGTQGDYQLTIDAPQAISSVLSLDAGGRAARTGSITLGDSDYFRLTAPTNTTGLFNAALSVGGAWDGVLHLYDEAGNLLGASDGGGGGADELLAFEMPHGGETVILRVGSNDVFVGGSYTLEVAFSMPSALPQIRVQESIDNSGDLQMHFGEVTVDTLHTATVTLENTGLMDLVVSVLTAGEGFDLSAGSQADNSGDDLVIAPGAELAVTVTFAPGRVGDFDSLLTIVSNDSTEALVQVALEGSAHPPEPEIGLSVEGIEIGQDGLAFGELQRGELSSKTITITNHGLAGLTVYNVAVAGPLQIIGDAEGTLLPGQSSDFVLEVQPDQRGQLDGKIVIVSDDPDEHTIHIDVTGQVLGGVLRVSENAQAPNDNHIDFGSVQAGQTVQQTVTLANIGDGPLVLQGLTASSLFGVNPVLHVTDGGDDLVLGAGQSLQVTVSFSPTALEAADGQVTITTDDIEAPVAVIELEAQALAGILVIQELDGAEDGATDLGRILVGTSRQVNVWQVSNQGNFPVTISLALAGGQDYQVAGPEQLTLSAGATQIVRVDFVTPWARQVTDTLTLLSDDILSTSVSLELSADAYALIGNGVKYRFADQSGDLVTLSLSGEAAAEVVIGTKGQPDIESITLLNGAGEETLNIQVNGPGRTLLKSLTGEESLTGKAGLKAVRAGKVDLVEGGINLGGNLSRLHMGAVLGGADIHFASEDGARVRLGQVVGDSTIEIDGGLRRFTAQDFIGGLLSADHLENMVVRGQMSAALEVTAGNLTSLVVQAGSLDGTLTVQGSVGKVVVREGNLLADLTVQNDIGHIVARRGAITGQIQASGTIAKVQAGHISHARIAALVGIERIRVQGNMFDSEIVVGYDFIRPDANSAHATGQIDAFLNSLHVKGSFGASTIAVGVAPDSDGSFIHGLANTARGEIGNVNLKQVQTNNPADPFGLIAQNAIAKLKIANQKITDDFQQDDFVVTILNK